MEARIHDNFCRCRACKPPLVGKRTQSEDRIIVAISILAAVAIALTLFLR